MRHHFRNDLMVLVIAATLGGTSGLAAAAGFALIEQSGSGMGNAFAGAAAVAEDASTVFFNPAGMSRLEGSQFAVAGHAVIVSAKFSGTGTRPVALGGPANTGGQGGDAGGTAVVPNAYFVMPLGDKMHFGIGVNVPFGLTTEYDATWVGRFQGIKSELITINVNPSFSYKVSEAVSLGVGLNYQTADAELTNASITALGEGLTKLEADDDAWGWNAGMLFQVGPATRIGVAYRSIMEYELEGNVTTTANVNGSVQAAGTFPAKADITFPDMFSLSLAQSLSDRLQLLADITFTRWSEIQQVLVKDSTGATRDSLNFNFDDAMRYSIGANCKWSDKWTLKAGLAFDETPVKDAQNRTVRLPDNDRTWVAFGGQMKLGARGKLDLGYSHLFIEDAEINFTRAQLGLPPAVASSTVTGTYEGSVDIFSIQYTHSF